jgi:hypothetical protein
VAFEETDDPSIGRRIFLIEISLGSLI